MVDKAIMVILGAVRSLRRIEEEIKLSKQKNY